VLISSPHLIESTSLARGRLTLESPGVGRAGGAIEQPRHPQTAYKAREGDCRARRRLSSSRPISAHVFDFALPLHLLLLSELLPQLLSTRPRGSLHYCQAVLLSLASPVLPVPTATFPDDTICRHSFPVGRLEVPDRDHRPRYPSYW
jgi:hypothetical protein